MVSLMPELNEHLIELLKSIKIQTDVVAGLSIGGLATTVLTYLARSGYRTEMDLSKFRGPKYLIFPLGAFAIAIAAGYLINMAISGFCMMLSRMSLQKRLE